MQRAALDLTLAALPMHNTQLLRRDLVKVVTSAILVVLRRDMSLNRYNILLALSFKCFIIMNMSSSLTIHNLYSN